MYLGAPSPLTHDASLTSKQTYPVRPDRPARHTHLECTMMEEPRPTLVDADGRVALVSSGDTQSNPTRERRSEDPIHVSCWGSVSRCLRRRPEAFRSHVNTVATGVLPSGPRGRKAPVRSTAPMPEDHALGPLLSPESPSQPAYLQSIAAIRGGISLRISGRALCSSDCARCHNGGPGLGSLPRSSAALDALPSRAIGPLLARRLSVYIHPMA